MPFLKRSCIALLMVVTVGCCLAIARVGSACDTPVYRYAMYRWLPAPYEVYYFHRDKMDEAAEAVKNNLDQYRDPDKAPANVIFQPVDLNKDKELTRVPPDVKKSWLEQENPKVPNYFISTPFGIKLHLGDLTEADLEALVDSPVRQNIGEQLKQGKAGVFLLLSGEKAEETQKAEKLLAKVVTDVNSGEVELYSMPMMPMDAESDDASAMRPKLGSVKVARDDPKESWLVRSLLAMEQDLPTVKDPIIFLIYGRGRALFSCLGKGIDDEILLADTQFITGACSCTVKDQNPGADLLMRYDWDAAAAHLAESYGAEEGNEFAVGGGGDNMFPELIVPSSGSADDEPKTPDENEPDSSDVAQTKPAAEMTDEPGSTASTADAADTAEPGPGATEPGKKSPESAGDAPEDQQPAETKDGKPAKEKDERQATAEPVPSASRPVEIERESAMSSVLTVAVGLLGLLVVLFAATFYVLRPK